MPTVMVQPCLPLSALIGGALLIFSHLHRANISSRPRPPPPSSKQFGSFLRGPPADDRGLGRAVGLPCPFHLVNTRRSLAGAASRTKPSSTYGPLPKGGSCNLDVSLYLLRTQVCSLGSPVLQAPVNETATVITSWLPLSSC